MSTSGNTLCQSRSASSDRIRALLRRGTLVVHYPPRTNQDGCHRLSLEKVKDNACNPFDPHQLVEGMLILVYLSISNEAVNVAIVQEWGKK
ncbi:hypothetical protein CR513_61555, partial [Mucuna pruriens]